MEDDNITRRNEALARFRESLSLPMAERYFTEDDLIDVFDFAGDVNDDYLRIEALMCAARFYPDSEELQQRKAIFYSQYSDDARQKNIEDNPQGAGMIWDILRARTVVYSTEESRHELLQRLVQSYDEWTDEETIQFMELVYDLDAYQWVKTHFDELRHKVTYINGLLYEMAVLADRNQDYANSIVVLEELTELEPFNLFYWMMLAREYAATNDNDRAVNAIDYAIAINPDEPQALFIKARLLYDADAHAPEAEGLLRRVIELTPVATDAARLLAAIRYDAGDKSGAYELLQNQLDKNPDEASTLIPDMIVYNPESTSWLLDKLYASEGAASQMVWETWAQQLSANGHPQIAKEVIDAFQRNSGEKIYTLFPIENAFREQRFGDTLMSLGEYLESNGTTDTDFPSMVYMHLISMIRVGEYDKALSFCDFFASHITRRPEQTISQRLELEGLAQIVATTQSRLLSTRNPVDWIDYDPLQIWSDEHRS